jgi:hypothetical protein
MWGCVLIPASECITHKCIFEDCLTVCWKKLNTKYKYRNFTITSSVPVMLLRGNIPSPNICTETRTQGQFSGFKTLVSAISSLQQIILFYALFFYLHHYSSYRNHLRRESNPGQFDEIVTIISVTSSLQKTTLPLTPFFYRA